MCTAYANGRQPNSPVPMLASSKKHLLLMMAWDMWAHWCVVGCIAAVQCCGDGSLCDSQLVTAIQVQESWAAGCYQTVQEELLFDGTAYWKQMSLLATSSRFWC